MKLIAIILCFVAVGSVNTVYAEQPKRFVLDHAAPLKQSIITLNTELNLAALRTRLDAEIPAVTPFSGSKGGCVKEKILFAKVSIGCAWKGEVQKRGPLTLTGQGDLLTVSLPLHAWVTVRGRGDVGKHIRETVKTDVTVFADARPTVDENWGLQLNLNPSFRWDKRPELDLLGGIKITLGSIVGPKLQAELDKLKAQLEQSLNSEETRPKIEAVWQELQQAKRITAEPPVWLRMIPQQAAFSGILTDNEVLRAVTRLDTQIETFVGAEPDPIVSAPLPDLARQSIAPGSVNLSLPVQITYQVLTDELEKVLRKGQRWLPVPDRPELVLLVEQVSIYPSGERLVVALQFMLPEYSDTTKIAAYLVGTPVIDNNTKTLSIKDFEYDATTGKLWADLLLAPLGTYFQQQITAKLKYDFSAEYARLQTQINALLNRSLKHGLLLQGKLDSINIQGIYPQHEALRIDVQSMAQVTISYGL